MDDLDIYLDAFGTPCTRVSDNAKFVGVLDVAEVELDIGSEGVETDTMELFYRLETAPALAPGDVINVGAAPWRVRSYPHRVDDGEFAFVRVIK